MNVIDYITITCNKKKVRLQITSNYMKKCNRLQLITITITITPCLSSITQSCLSSCSIWGLGIINFHYFYYEEHHFPPQYMHRNGPQHTYFDVYPQFFSNLHSYDHPWSDHSVYHLYTGNSYYWNVTHRFTSCQGKYEVVLLRKHNVFVETVNMPDSR